MFTPSDSNEEHVGDNGKLTVESKRTKLTYTDAVRVKEAVSAQNEHIANGKSPIDEHKLHLIKKETIMFQQLRNELLKTKAIFALHLNQ